MAEILVGTTKGLFVLRWDETGRPEISGPHCGGWPINHAIRAGDVLLAGGGGDFPGAGVWRSEDDGATWTLVKLADGEMDDWMRNDPETAAALGYEPTETGPLTGRIKAIWSLHALGSRVLAGAKPATLLASDDAGVSWQVLEGLTDHPSADSWTPGAAGLTLHSMVSVPGQPEKLWLGISAAGVFASEDGGETWERRNRLGNLGACAHHGHPAGPRDGDTGHCVHNIVRARGEVDLLYQQNHHGVFRSHDGGRSWDDITEGLPSAFGFPIGVDPEHGETIYTIPLNGDSAGRYPVGAAAAVWRSRDGGETWEACRTGLPQAHCYFTVLRQAMGVSPAGGVFFGTNSGSVFGSLDRGDTWVELAQHLPTVLCVEAF